MKLSLDEIASRSKQTEIKRNEESETSLLNFARTKLQILHKNTMPSFEQQDYLKFVYKIKN